MAEALALAGAGVDELDARLDGAAEDLDEGELAVLRVVEALEDEDDRTVVVGVDVELLAVDQRDLAKVGHRGEPCHGGGEDGDDALLLDGRGCEGGNEHAVANGGGEQALELLLGDLLTLEVLHHDLVVGLGHEVDEGLAGSLGVVGILGRNLGLDDLGALEVTGLHVHDVDDAGEGVTGAHGDGDGTHAVAETLPAGIQGGVEVGLGTVEAVDDHGASEGEILGGVPEAGGGGLRAVVGVDHEQRGLGGAHSGVGVTHEVGVARGVEHVDARALPLDRSHGGRDGEAAGALLAVIVERGLCAGMAAQAAGLAGEMQHCLGQHGLARAGLSHKDDVLNNCFFCHGSS